MHTKDIFQKGSKKHCDPQIQNTNIFGYELSKNHEATSISSVKNNLFSSPVFLMCIMFYWSVSCELLYYLFPSQ